MQRFTYMRHVMARKAKQPKRWFQRLQPLSHQMKQSSLSIKDFQVLSLHNRQAGLEI